MACRTVSPDPRLHACFLGFGITHPFSGLSFVPVDRGDQVENEVVCRLTEIWSAQGPGTVAQLL